MKITMTHLVNLIRESIQEIVEGGEPPMPDEFRKQNDAEKIKHGLDPNLGLGSNQKSKPIKEAAGSVIYLVGLDIPYESPMIYGAFSDKQKALKAIETLKQDEDSMDNQAIWTIEVNDKLMSDDIMFGHAEKV